MTTCKNCENTFEGKYCPNCSQKADTHRFTLKHFTHELFHAFTHADKGIFFLMKELFIQPGNVAREFNSGKRKKYFNPITYLLLIMALQIFLSEKTHIMDFSMEQIQSTQTDVSSQAELKKITEVVQTAQRLIQEHSKLFNLLFLPILALLIWVFFKRSGNNYAEVLVLTVLYLAQVLLFFIILCIIPFLIYPQSVLITINLYGILTYVYMIIAIKQFFQQRWLPTIVKGLIVQLLYYIAMFAIILAIALTFWF